MERGHLGLLAALGRSVGHSRLREQGLGHQDRRAGADRESDRVRGTRVDDLVAGVAADGDLGVERPLLEPGHRDLLDAGVQAVDQGGHQVVHQGTRRRLSLGDQHDRRRLLGTDPDGQQRPHAVVSRDRLQDDHRLAPGVHREASHPHLDHGSALAS